MRDLQEVLGTPLDPDDRADSRRRLLELGHVVSFIVDGDCAEVSQAHGELKVALASGRKFEKQLAALTKALLANEDALAAFGEQ